MKLNKKEFHNKNCTKNKNFKWKWLGSPFMPYNWIYIRTGERTSKLAIDTAHYGSSDISVDSYKCPKCGLEIWLAYGKYPNGESFKYRRTRETFSLQDIIKEAEKNR